MSKKFEKNPFINIPLSEKDISKITARENQLQEVKEMLNSYNTQSAFASYLRVNGERGVGKSTIKNKIMSESSHYNFLPIELTLNVTNENKIKTIDFFWMILDRLLEKICEDTELKKFYSDNWDYATNEADGVDIEKENMFFNISRKKKQSYENSNLQINSRDIIRDFQPIINDLRVKENKENYRVIFFIDEAQCIYNSSDILNLLRELQQKNIGIIFFFFSRPILEGEDVFNEIWGTTDRFGKVIELNNFEKSSDVRNYFEKCLASIGWEPKDWNERNSLFWNFDKDCETIYQFSKGRPAFISRIAWKMFDLCANGHSTQMKVKDAIEEIRQKIDINHTRLNKILELSDLEKYWAGILINSQGSSPNNIYEWMISLYPENHKYFINPDNFKELIGKLFFDILFFSFYINISEKESISKIMEAKNIRKENQTSDIGFKLNETSDISDTFRSILNKIMNRSFRAEITSDEELYYQIKLEDYEFRFDSIPPVNHFIDKLSDMIFEEVNLIESTTFNSKELNTDEIIKKGGGLCLNKEMSIESISFLKWYFKLQLRYKNNSYILKIDDGKDIRYISVCKELSRNKKEKNIKVNETYDDYIISNVKKDADSIINNLSLNKFHSVSLLPVHKHDIKLLTENFLDSSLPEINSIVLENYHSNITSQYLHYNQIPENRSLEFYKLFKKGVSINPKYLSDVAYVFSIINNKNSLEKSQILLEYAVKKIIQEGYDHKIDNYFVIPQYNLGIIYYKLNKQPEAIKQFQNVIADFDQYAIPVNMDDGSVLEYINSENKILEKKKGINILELAKENLNLLQVK